MSYEVPLLIRQGAFQYLYDHEGKTFIDCVNNVTHVGHCHPYLTQIASYQMSKLNTNTRYLHPEIIELAENLKSRLPSPLDTFYFVCSGSEANELAIRLAKAYLGRENFIVLDGAYHGNTSTLIDLSPYKHKGPGGKKRPDWVFEAPLPCTSQKQKLESNDHSSPAEKSHKFIEQLCANIIPEQSLAGFICEAFPSCAGQIELPKTYLDRVYALVRRYGGLCIADEVQTGFGRIGTHYWGFEALGVIPDIVTLGKPMGNGHPIGAVITTRQIANKFNNGMEYFNSFGGNPVSCAIANGVMQIIDEERLQEHALKTGKTIKNALQQLCAQSDIIEEVRGQGLFLGVELKNKVGSIDLKAFHHRVIESMKSRGFLLSLDGFDRNVIKIKPPLSINYENIEKLYLNFQEVIAKIENRI